MKTILVNVSVPTNIIVNHLQDANPVMISTNFSFRLIKVVIIVQIIVNLVLYPQKIAHHVILNLGWCW